MYNFEELLSESGEYGIVTEAKPPLIVLSGLANVHVGEIIVFETGQIGEVFTLGRDQVQVQIFSPGSIRVGTRATRTNKTIGIPVGEELLGKIIDPLGESKSEGQEYVRPEEEKEIDVSAPGLITRAKITKPFSTGTAVIDMMIPLGCGQKQLVIGDRKTGKTSFLLSVIKNQVKLGTVIVYAAISKQKSDIKKIQNFFVEEGLTNNTVVVASEPDDSPSLIFLTPYSAMTIGEFFLSQGRNVLVVLDDLSTHAKFYREVSLLADRFPGRDSYPGDIFYTHARLLERAGNFKVEGGGERSLTVLPVAEIVEGDFTGYIATNLMGMTDGHIYFDSNVYYRGIRPAVNISLSVTRVGRQAQNDLTRSINRELTAFLALYEKMQNLSHFGAELSDTVKQVLSTGEMVYAFFEQLYKVVVSLEVQIILFSMLWLKFFDKTDKDSIAKYREALNNAYQNPSNKQLLDNFLQNSKSFNELLGKISQYKAQLLEMCNITGTTDTQAAIKQVDSLVQKKEGEKEDAKQK